MIQETFLASPHLDPVLGEHAPTQDALTTGLVEGLMGLRQPTANSEFRDYLSRAIIPFLQSLTRIPALPPAATEYSLFRAGDSFVRMRGQTLRIEGLDDF